MFIITFNHFGNTEWPNGVRRLDHVVTRPRSKPRLVKNPIDTGVGRGQARLTSERFNEVFR